MRLAPQKSRKIIKLLLIVATYDDYVLPHTHEVEATVCKNYSQILEVINTASDYFHAYTYEKGFY